MTRWTHLHTAAAGLVLGLALDHETLVVLVLGAAGGAFVVLAWRYARRVAGFTREQASRISAARAEAARARAELDLAEADRKRAVAVELLARAEHRVYTAREQEKERDHAYRMGAADAVHHAETWAPDPREVT